MRMSDVAALGAGASSANILAGKLHEFIGSPVAAVSVHATGGGAGMMMSCMIGNRTIVDDQEVSALTTYPLIPDDTVISGEAALGGERLTIRMRNSTVGALTYSVVVDVEAL